MKLYVSGKSHGKSIRPLLYYLSYGIIPERAQMKEKKDSNHHNWEERDSTDDSARKQLAPDH